MQVKRMSVREWIAVPPNPIQRNTERHAAKANHLRKPLSIHSIVYAAELPDGSLVKLDGHTRALLWKRNEVRHPPEVYVHIIRVASLDEAKHLYMTLDSKEALETTTDKVSGAFSELKFAPESSLLRSGNIATAMKLCWNVRNDIAIDKTRVADMPGYNVYLAIDEFKTELFALDALCLKTGVAGSGLVAAFILTYRKHGPEVLQFWHGYFGNAGMKIEGRMDAIQALRELVMARKGKQMISGSMAIIDLCARAVMAAEKWLRDEDFTAIPRPYNLIGYIDTARPAITLIKGNGNKKKETAEARA
jgi:hypothetical protein